MVRLIEWNFRGRGYQLRGQQENMTGAGMTVAGGLRSTAGCVLLSVIMSSRFGLRTVATFEAAKGVIVLAVGLGLFRLIHRDVEAGAEKLVRHLHFNPASHYPRILIDAAGRIDDAHLRLLAIGALVYAAIRFTEACGLWLDRRWAEWFGAISGAIYLPLEVYNLWEGVTWPRVTVLVVNSIIVIYLVQVLVRGQSGPPKVAVSPPVAAAP
jgi:uncharacterized membrane protein (DUF2068 family)